MAERNSISRMAMKAMGIFGGGSGGRGAFWTV